MHRSFIFLIICQLLAAPVIAQIGSSEGTSWGALKSSFCGTISEPGHDKVQFPSPWPFSYTRHSSIDETDAMRAMLYVGLQDLMACSDVFVMGPTGSVGVGEIAIVSATRANGYHALWTVDLVEELMAQEITITSLDVNSITAIDELTGNTISAAMIDAAAEDEDAQEHLEAYVEAYEIEGTDGFWDKLKDAWNGMNLCEQVFLVGGVVVCSATQTVGAGVICGAGMFIASATVC